MSLFGPQRPKGITKDELYYIRGELGASHGASKLTDRQIDEVIERLELALDSDSALEHRNKWKQAGADEVAAIESQTKDRDGTPFSPAQQERVHAVLQKYLDINKVRSLF